MNRNLSYFMIREIIACFMRKDHVIEENDVINFLLIELKKNKVTENMDKINLDFSIVYILFDLLETMGILVRKIEMNQKYLTWKGFAGFKKSNPCLMGLIDNSFPMQSEDNQSTPTEIFINSFFERMHSRPGNKN